MVIEYNQKLISAARELRKNMTKQERHLWYDFLRDYPIQFQRQKPIKSFIVDFYCAKAKLVIELDGSQHYLEQGITYDTERDNILKSYGLEVLRFSNKDVDDNFNGVCTMIDMKVKKGMSL